MKTMKKVAAFLFALLLVLSTASLSVTAEGETGNIGITITADKQDKYLYPGDIVTFTINISTDFNYTAMRWPIMFTTKAFEPVVNGDMAASYGNVIGRGELAQSSSYLESEALPSNSEAFGGTYSKNNYSGILVQWTAGTTSSGMTYYNHPSGFDCLTFQLRVKSGYTANKGKGIVAIPTTTQAKKVFYYQGISNPANISTVYKMDSETCNVTANVCELNYIVSEAAGLTPAAGSDTVLDTSKDDNYIYGFTSVIRDSIDLDEDTIKNYVKFLGKATCSIDENDTGNYSTGSLLHVYDANGVEIDQYTIIVFGDISGDGAIDSYDEVLLISAINNNEPWSEGDVYDNPWMFSCDVNGDGSVFWEDFNILEMYGKGRGIPNQTQTGPGLIT